MGRTKKLVAAASVAVAGAATFAVTGPVGGRAWGTATICIINKNGPVTQLPAGTNGGACATSTFGPGKNTAVAVAAKPGSGAGASAGIGGTAVAVNNASASAVAGSAASVNCPGTVMVISGHAGCANGK